LRRMGQEASPPEADKLLPNEGRRRGQETPPYNGRGKPLPNRTAGGHRCARPTERQWIG